MRDKYTCFLLKQHSSISINVTIILVAIWQGIQMKSNYDDYISGSLSLYLLLLAGVWCLITDSTVIYYALAITSWQQKYKNDVIDLFDESEHQSVCSEGKTDSEQSVDIFFEVKSASSKESSSQSRLNLPLEDEKLNIFGYITEAKFINNIGFLCSMLIVVGVGLNIYVIEITKGCRDTCMKRIPILAIITLCYLPIQLMTTFKNNWKRLCIVELFSKIICFACLYLVREDIVLDKLNNSYFVNMGMWIIWLIILYSKNVSLMNTFRQREVLTHVSSTEERKRLLAELSLIE
jgi:hypothetical protein